MNNFLHKKEWTDNEWNVFFSNLDLLRNKLGLKKGELSKAINVTNIYRTDRKSCSKKIINAVCDKFDTNEGRLRLYDFRHAFATYTLKHNADLKAVSETLGHSRTDTTTRIYQHTDTDMHREAVGKMPKLDL